MSSGWLVVLQKTSALFLLMVVGWLVSRRGLWKTEASLTLSRFLVDFVYPSYIISQFLRTVDGDTLRLHWYIPLLGFLVIAIGEAVGLIASPLVRDPVRRRTVVFLVSLTNWIYLPLPIAEGLFGAEGVRSILLMNVGCTAAIWTIGIATLNPGMTPRESLRHVVVNPGILATLVGLLLAVYVPSLRNDAAGVPFLKPVLEAANLLSALTIPLSLLVIGTRLGERPLSALRPEPALWGVLALRLVAAPLVALGLVRLLAACGWPLPEAPRFSFLLVAAMPPALSCTMFTERYNGDSLLSAKAVFLGTLLSLATVPLFFKWILSAP
ncbi:MAG: AEC family transporter [Kiritimatiellia bacterium]